MNKRGSGDPGGALNRRKEKGVRLWRRAYSGVRVELE